MNNEQSNPVILSSAPYAPAPGALQTVKPRLKFEKRDWICLLAALLLGVYPALAFYIGTLFKQPNLPGIGSCVFFLAILVFGICLCGKEKLRQNKAAVFVLAAAAASALSLGLWSYAYERLLAHFAAFGLSAIGLLSLSGMNRRALSRAGVLGESFVNAFAAMFAHMFKPFMAAPEALGRKKSAVLGVVIGVLVSIPLIALVTALLSSADSFFSSTVSAWMDIFEDFSIPRLLWYGVRIVFFTLLLFSVFYALRHPKGVVKRESHVPAVPVSFTVTVLVLLALLYILFFGSVITGLTFANLRDPEFFAENGGYAQYAREGFFQLAAVAAINFCAVGIACYVNNKSLAVRILSVILGVQTLILLASAVVRMCCYIDAYGLSFLRLMTFLCMAVIACAMVLSVIKAFRPDFRIFPILAVFSLSLWIVFSLCDTSRLIAAWNVDHYLSGSLESADVDYLTELSPSVIPELERLIESGSAEDARRASDAILRMRRQERGGWWLWSADQSFLGPAPTTKYAASDEVLITVRHAESEDVYSLTMAYYLDGKLLGSQTVTEASGEKPLGKGQTEYFELNKSYDFPENADLSKLSLQFSVSTLPYGSEIDAGSRLYIPAAFGESWCFVLFGNSDDGFAVHAVPRDTELG